MPEAATSTPKLLRPNRGWFIGGAGMVAAYILDHIDAPLWLGLLTLGVLLAAAVLWPYIEGKHKRHVGLWIALGAYAIFVVAALFAIHRSGRDSHSPIATTLQPQSQTAPQSVISQKLPNIAPQKARKHVEAPTRPAMTPAKAPEQEVSPAAGPVQPKVQAATQEVSPAAGSVQPKVQAPTPPKIITWDDFMKQQEAERAKRHAAEPPEPPCTGNNLTLCGDRALLEWGKPLMERITRITDELSLDMKIAADRFSGDKYFKAVQAAENTAFDQYRECCAADALKYDQELANRLGGGKQSEDLKQWTALVLRPQRSKEWKEARYGSHIKLMDLVFEFGQMERELDTKEKSKHLRD